MQLNVKLFSATTQPALESAMNTFLSTLTIAMVVDIETTAIHSQSAAIHYIGLVIYQA